MKKLAISAALLLFIAAAASGCSRYQRPTATPISTKPSQLHASGDTIGPSQSAVPLPATLLLPSVSPQFPETPAPALSAKAGNIPASQNFVSYSSADGRYDVQYPEAWTPAVLDGDARFTHGYDGLQVTIAQSTDAFTVDAIMNKQVADLIRTGRAVDVKNVSRVTTKSGDAVLVEYNANSEPIDGKKVRLTCLRYYFYRNGTLAALTMWAPTSANNANIFKQIPDTFVWR